MSKEATMKIFRMLFVLVLLSLSGAVVADSIAGGGDPVAPKHKSLFVVKADREFVGANVQVFYSNGNLITAQKLQKKKMIIDFEDAKMGTYTIRVTKGGKTKEFEYIKK